MKRIIATLILVMIVSVCYGKPRHIVVTKAMGSATAVTNTVGGDLGITGSINEIMVSCSTTTYTGNVKVAYTPFDGYASNVEIATNVVVGTKTWRPRLDGTDITGTALSSDPQDNKYLLVNENIRWIVSGSPTNVTWVLTIKLDE